MSSFYRQLSGDTLSFLKSALAQKIQSVTVLVRNDPLKWHGVIRGRAWDASFTEQEYLLMLAGGTQQRLNERTGSSHQELPGWLQTQIQKDLDAHCREVFEFENVACNVGRAVMLNLAANQVSTYQGIQVFAVGNSTVLPTASDLTLGNELFRKSISNTAVSGNQLDVSTYFGTTEGNYVYAEAGIFGNGASNTQANNGTIFAHAQYTYTKTSSITLTNDYFIQLL